MKRPTVEEFINVWSEAVLGKGLTFDFFSDPLVRKAILVTAQCADSIITFADSSAKDTSTEVVQIRLSSHPSL